MIKLLLSLALWFSNISCDPELETTLAQVRKLKGGNELVEKVLEDGSITIKTEKEFPFEAYWDAPKRTIGIVEENSRIYALIFELQNAASQKEFDRLNLQASKGKISKEAYIRAVETIEYENTRKTGALIDEGVTLGLFPSNSKVHYKSGLESHLRDQEATGHSAWIGEIYDSLS